MLCGYERVQCAVNIVPNAWLQRFRGRNEIMFRAISGQSNDVKEENVTEWTEKLQVLMNVQNTEDVFNCDGTALLQVFT